MMENQKETPAHQSGCVDASFLACEQRNKLSFWPNLGQESPGVKGYTERLKN